MTALAMVAAASLTGAAQAQTAAAPAAPAASAPTPDTGAGAAFNDEQVKHFAAALMSVKKVSDEYQPKIAAASGDAATTLRNDMATKMHDALTSSGVSDADYAAIAAAVPKDPALKIRIGQQMADLQAAAGTTGQ
ncbi:hypothetical protein DJ021_12885 [Phenylobacterium hankyongense]|uniref:DUF4168 domain-containing protein n=2 Tax=Phenylobacterium hankyongense TaxID=1813876 RepID=A0A328AZT9_9CAUL|nr:hypothetical protein DJ021_12885 [Phenylobacterium hankyongense]